MSAPYNQITTQGNIEDQDSMGENIQNRNFTLYPPRPNLIRHGFCSECQSPLETEYLNGQVTARRCSCPRHN